ncbi:MAG: tetratricopeptide repeat protein [Piscinibacter sp.]|uniref:tetratricopeptide repeat protein n=1 Tax=Piscinibacter sp. TaxID=1903157 RepID=UPI001B462423|nr:tetratricopeptide repeat protein [Piscinibacter sp.]MBP5991123.1 tetratricopeptide repeat protein [Piscinibacter sp.]MBP6028335.1 tetratricopeptide repeat protein [Piscinibacter sp.]
MRRLQSGLAPGTGVQRSGCVAGGGCVRDRAHGSRGHGASCRLAGDDGCVVGCLPRASRADDPALCGPDVMSAELRAQQPGSEPRMFVLGPPELRAAAAPAFAPERRFQLLAVLAVRSGQWMTRDELASLLWPEHANADARRNLRHVIFKARALPGVDGIDASEHALRWRVSTDLLAFEQAWSERDALVASAWRRGALLDGIDDPANAALGEWLAAERARFDSRWQQAAHAALGASTTAPQRADIAQRLLEVDPLDESALSALLQAEMALGQRAAAERRYRDYAHRLAAELGVEPSRRLRDLFAPTAVAADTSNADRRAPPEAALFVGRRSELAELNALLATAECRLVTIIGPGGIGKSRLAAQALRRIATEPGTGVWIELQDLSEVAALSARLAQRLGVTLADAHDPLEQIGRHVGSGRLCCVLDNAEHLAELPAWVEQLLAAAPSLVLLVTSRSRLHLAAERPFTLTGLAVPDEDSRDLEAASAFDAVRLFEARAAAAQRGFELARHLPAVIEIVEATGGMPLAIELAAAWVRLLPPEEIARELRDSLDLLERDPASPGAPARPEHRSLHAVLERTWQLLAPAERDAMAALAVCRGGFTRAAAAAVAAAPLPLLSSLVDKSLLAVDENGRFGMHPLIAAEAAARLAADGARGRACRDRHAAYFAEQLETLVRRAGADHSPVADGVEHDFANCAAAWTHAIGCAAGGLVARSVEAWRVYFESRGEPARGVAHFRAALGVVAAERGGDALGARLRAALSRLLYRQADFDGALSVARTGADLALRSGDRRALVACLSNAGSALCAMGQWTQARQPFEHALAIAREDSVAVEIGTALTNLGIVAKKDGRYDDALSCYAQAIDIERELGHHMAVVRCLNNIAGVHMERNQWAEARPFMERGLRLCEHHRLGTMTPYLAFGLGAVQFELGDLDPAEARLRQALEHARSGEIPVVAILAEANLARVAARRGDFVAAGERLAAAAREASERGWTNQLLHQALFLGECCMLAGGRERAARLWQMVAAHPGSEAGLRDSALRWQAALALPNDELDAAQRDPPTLEATVDCLLRGGDLVDAAGAVR